MTWLPRLNGVEADLMSSCDGHFSNYRLLSADVYPLGDVTALHLVQYTQQPHVSVICLKKNDKVAENLLDM